MALKIDTFDNRTGGNSYYKAVSHPLAAKAATGLSLKFSGAFVFHSLTLRVVAVDPVYLHRAGTIRLAVDSCFARAL